MKNLFFLVTCLLWFTYCGIYAQSYKSFQSRYTLGTSLEFLGISPLGSGNIELMTFKRPKNFINMQLGIGLISLPRDLFSVSQAITYNYWVNQRNSLRKKYCRPERKERRTEYFIEIGVANFILAGVSPGEQIFYTFPVTGLRVHFTVRHKSVIFAKFRYMPLASYVQQSHIGIALGTSL